MIALEEVWFRTCWDSGFPLKRCGLLWKPHVYQGCAQAQFHHLEGTCLTHAEHHNGLEKDTYVVMSATGNFPAIIVRTCETPVCTVILLRQFNNLPLSNRMFKCEIHSNPLEVIVSLGNRPHLELFSNEFQHALVQHLPLHEGVPA